MNGVACNSSFAHGAFSAIEKDIIGTGFEWVEIIFDIVTYDLNVADFAFSNNNTTPFAIADVIACDIDLMKVDFVHENANA